MTAKPKPIKYIVTLPDGKIDTRESIRPFAAALAVFNDRPDHGPTGWFNAGFAGSINLAQKHGNRWAMRGFTVRIVPVSVA